MTRSLALALALSLPLLTGCDSGDDGDGAGSGGGSLNATYSGTGVRDGVTYTVTVPITGKDLELRTSATTFEGGGKKVTLNGRGALTGGTLGFTALTSASPSCNGSVIGQMSDDRTVVTGVQAVVECDNGTYIFLDPITLRRT